MAKKTLSIILVSVIAFILGVMGLYLSLAYLSSYPTETSKTILTRITYLNVSMVPISLILAFFVHSPKKFIVNIVHFLVVIGILIFGTVIQPQLKEERNAEYRKKINERILKKVEFSIDCTNGDKMILTKPSENNLHKSIKTIYIIKSDRTLTPIQLDRNIDGKFHPRMNIKAENRKIIEGCGNEIENYKTFLLKLKS